MGIEPVVEDTIDETYFDTNTRGVSTKGGLVRQYNKPGKLSQSSLSNERKSKNPELRMSKKELRTSMIDDANYEKKMGRSKPTPSNLKTALKKQEVGEGYGVSRTVVRQGIKMGGKRGGRAAQGALASGKTATKHVVERKPGKGEAIGSVVGSLAGGIGGGIAGTPLGGVGSIATGVAGGQVGEKIGGAIGKKFDKKKTYVPVKKESFSDWRKDLGEEGYDRMRDDRLVKYGIGHDGSDKKGSIKRAPETNVKGKTVLQKETEKKYGKGLSALDVVKKQIEDKHGKGVIYDGKKK